MYKVEEILNWLLVMVLSGLAIFWLCSSLTGCGSTRGWNVSFGVNPVSAVSNHQSLNTLESNYVSKGDPSNAAQTK
jgi:hypothetical protein